MQSNSVEASDNHNQGVSNTVETMDDVKMSEDKKECMVEASSDLESSQEIISRLEADLDKLASKNKKLRIKKEALGNEYDELEKYLTKIEMKLDKRESKLE